MARQILLKKALVILLGSAAVVMGMSGSARALTVNFDDLPENGTSVYGGYAGLNWSNFYAGKPETFGSNTVTGYHNGRVSLQNVAFNSFGNPAEITSSSAFTFNSTYLTGAWNNGLNILVEGFQNGNSLFTRSLTVDSTNPTLFTFDWVGIDLLRFTSSGGVNAGYNGDGSHFAMDNFTFNEPITTVPTPALLPGLVGMGFTAWRKRRAESRVLVPEKV